MTLKIGQVVQLKSGGPHMTVVYIDRSGESGPKASVIWFKPSEEQGNGKYPEKALNLITDTED